MLFYNYKNKICIIFLYCCCFIALISVILFTFSKSINLDETFTMKLIEKSYTDIIKLTAIDVHPPLYYISTKAFVDIMSNIFTGVNPVYFGKLASVIPSIILIGVSVIVIRREWGGLTSALFSLCIISMPRFMDYNVQIRMYTFSLLFVTLCFISAYYIVKNNSLKHWILITVFSLAAAYSHYFAALGIAFIYLYLFLEGIKSQRNILIRLIIVISIIFLLYLPWLIALFKQIILISNKSLRIDPITIKDIIGYLCYPLLPVKILPYSLIGLLFISLYIYLLYNIYKLKKSNDIERKTFEYLLLGLFIPMAVIIVGILISLMFSPIFLNRYMLPSLGAFWLSFSICIKYLKPSILKICTYCYKVRCFFPHSIP